jgi:hypothetical protein
LRAIVGSVYDTHHQYDATCLNWQSVINGGHKLRRLRQFKALCDNDYVPCRGEYYSYKEWAAVITVKPKYITIMSGLITDKDEDNKKIILTMGQMTIAGRHTFGASPIVGLSLLALTLSMRGSLP